MNIKIICVGKLKEKYLSDAMEEYSKRLSRFCKLETVQVNDLKIAENASEKECMQVLEKEGEAILSKIKPTQFVIALCVEGAQKTSEEFAEVLSSLALSSKSDIAFVIGGSLGLSDAVKKRADMRLGFSKMTFPHQLMRVILAEQIYRGFKIINNESYHK